MDKYTVLKTIGKGSFGSCLLVQHKTTNKQFAIKQINVQQMDSAQKREAMNEVKVLAMLRYNTLTSLSMSIMQMVCTPFLFPRKNSHMAYNYLTQRRIRSNSGFTYRHPNIIAYQESFLDEGHLNIVMEYAEGTRWIGLSVIAPC